MNSVELRVIGDNLGTTIYEFSADGSDNYQTISNLNTVITVNNVGNKLRSKISINSADTRIDSLALYYK